MCGVSGYECVCGMEGGGGYRYEWEGDSHAKFNRGMLCTVLAAGTASLAGVNKLPLIL